MTNDEFIRLFEVASPEDWERIYAAHSVELSRDDAFEIFAADHPFSKWFGFRFDAGPPGTPLPAFEDSYMRVLQAPRLGGGPLDAYRVIFADQPLPPDLPLAGVFPILANCVGLALQNGGTWFATWLAARAGLASIVAGQSEFAWRYLEHLLVEDELHPNFRVLSKFEVLREHPDLLANSWIKAAILNLWPQLTVPLLPHLPSTNEFFTDPSEATSLPAIMQRLDKINAKFIQQLLHELTSTLYDRHNQSAEDRQREHAEILPIYLEFRRQISAAVYHLGDLRTLSRSDIEIAVDSLSPPQISIAMCELVAESTSPEEPPLESLLKGLVLRKAIQGTERETILAPAFTQIAADALFDVKNIDLFEFRIELLTDLIAYDSTHITLAELYFQRANSRNTLPTTNLASFYKVLEDYRSAMNSAREYEEFDWYAMAASGFAKALLAPPQIPASELEKLSSEARKYLIDCQSFTLEPFRRAIVLQGLAHLVRTDTPQDAITLLTEARDLLVLKEPFRTELSADLVQTLVFIKEYAQALDIARKSLDEAIEIGDCLELGLLQLAFGLALIESDQPEEAHPHLEAALTTLRGRDFRQENMARLHLAEVLAKLERWDAATEHLRQLRDRWDELPNNEKPNIERIEEFVKSNRSSSFTKAQNPLTPPHIATSAQKTSFQESYLSELEIETLAALFVHPSGQLYGEYSRRLATPDLRAINQMNLSAEERLMVETEIRTHNLLNDPEEIENLLLTLEKIDPETAEGPGALVARVHYLAHLTRLGRRPATEVMEATEIARSYLQNVDNLSVRIVLLRALAQIWSPDDHRQDPICDFTLATELLQTVVELRGSEERSTTDTIGLLARALRYTEVGDHRSNLRESRSLYQILVNRLEGTKLGDLLANALTNLAEVEAHLADGPRLERSEHAEKLLHRAVKVAETPQIVAQAYAMLGWQQTQVGMLLDGDNQIAKFEEALVAYSKTDFQALPAAQHSFTAGNLALCEAELAETRGDRNAALQARRKRLAELGKERPYQQATAQHNLAASLLSGEDITPADVAEGLHLCEQAATVRTLSTGPRHCWETALLAGSTLVRVMNPTDSLPPDGLNWTPNTMWERAHKWLQLAAEAGQNLGRGEELFTAALAHQGLVAAAPNLKRALEVAESAWSFVEAASPYLLLNPRLKEDEASFSHSIAVSLADRISYNTPQTSESPFDFVLYGEYLEPVARWLHRGYLPLRRPLYARLRRPEDISPRLWAKWQSALSSKNLSQATELLEEIKKKAPQFLNDESSSSMKETWRWLECHDDSALLGLTLTHSKILAFIAKVDSDGQRRTWLIGIRASTPPVDLDKFPLTLKHAADDGKKGDLFRSSHHQITSWIQEQLVAPIQTFLDIKPSNVLWVPGPKLRCISPSSIWKKTPVVSSLSLSLPDVDHPGRRRSTLLVLAAAKNDVQLKEAGPKSLHLLNEAAIGRGPTRLLASVGSQYGYKLFPAQEANVRETPASATDLLNESKEHDLIVAIAHGEMNSPTEAALICVNAEGQIEKLTVENLSKKPGQFTGASIILLSCETGRVGENFAEPGGIAGALIGAGAKLVVAPLWPVHLDSATSIAVEILKGLSSGLPIWQVIAELDSKGQAVSPLLGPSSSPSAQQAHRESQHQAFVTWVG